MNLVRHLNMMHKLPVHGDISNGKAFLGLHQDEPGGKISRLGGASCEAYAGSACSNPGSGLVARPTGCYAGASGPPPGASSSSSSRAEGATKKQFFLEIWLDDVITLLIDIDDKHCSTEEAMPHCEIILS
eukprot:SAG22_NODE_137_length_18056_cov_9.974940_2_plen_130_part_00